MRNDVSFMKLRAIKRYSKLFYDWLFFFVSFDLGSLHSRTGAFCGEKRGYPDRRSSRVVDVAQAETIRIVLNRRKIQRGKSFKNPLDKEAWKCYNVQAVRETANEPAKISRKKLKKLSKKLLTKGKRCDIIAERFWEGQASERHPKGSRKKLKKLSKNLLTNEKRCDIIVGHFRRTARTRFRKDREKSFSKTFQKPLDKSKRMWYNNEVASNAACEGTRTDHW